MNPKYILEYRLTKASPLFTLLLCISNILIVDNVLASVGSELFSRPENDQVWDLRFTGNESFKDGVLKEVISAEDPTFWEKIKFWNRSGHDLSNTEIRKDVIRIRRFYERRGFHLVEVGYRIETAGKEWKKRLIFEIEENPPLIIKELTQQIKVDSRFYTYIAESSEFKNARDRHVFQTGRRYEQIREPDVIGRYTDALKNLGFAFAEVNIFSRIDSAKNSVNLNIELLPGPQTRIDRIEVEGTETISKTLVRKESGLKHQELFSQKKLQNAQLELFNHHMFRFATISIPQQDQDTTLNLNITIRENKPRSIQIQGGIGTEEIVRGQVGWVHRNMLRKANRFSVTGRASFIEQTFNIDYLIPYAFNTKSSLLFSPFLQHLLEKSFELFRGGITNSFIYQYNDNLTTTASYQFTRNLELSQQFDVTLPDTTLEYNLSSFRLNGYYSPGYRQQEEGWVIQPFAEFSGFFGAASFSFQKYSLDLRKFTSLRKSTKLAARAQVGGLFNAKTDSLPQNLRFFLGGTSSVRGWARHELGPKRARVDSAGFIRYVPVGGRAMFGFNVEIRQELNAFIKGFGVTVFLDGGQVWESPGRLNERPIQFAAGGGLRYRSPIGPLRIDIGYKLNPSNRDLNIFEGENFGNTLDRIGIHFSVGQAF